MKRNLAIKVMSHVALGSFVFVTSYILMAKDLNAGMFACQEVAAEGRDRCAGVCPVRSGAMGLCAYNYTEQECDCLHWLVHPTDMPAGVLPRRHTVWESELQQGSRVGIPKN